MNDLKISFKKLSIFKKSSGQIEYLCDLLESELVDALFKEIGYKLNQNIDTYEYDFNANNEQKKVLIEIAFDSYLNFHFYDNLINYLNFKNESDPLKIIELLLQNEINFNQIYNSKTNHAV